MNRRSFLALSSAAALPVSSAAAPGRSRLRSAICAYSFRKELESKAMSYEDLVRLAVDLDVPGLDLTVYWFPDTSDAFLLPLRRAAYRNAVEIYSISVRTTMTQPAAALRDAEVAKIRDWIDVAQKLGAGHIRVFGGDVPKGASEEQAVPWVVETLKRAADYAAAKGIILGLENHGGITERAARILEIVRKADSPWVGVNLDTGNFHTDILPQIEMCLPYAVNVQVKAEIRGPGGSPVRQDWRPIVAMLNKAGYKGYLALEYEAKEPAPAAVPRLIRELQRVIAAG